jgi:plastocyanin
LRLQRSNSSCARLRRRLAIRLFALPLCAATSQSTTIVQANRAFAISAISIARGETLRFSNEDGFTHQIYIETPQFTFESDEQEPGQTVSVTFPASGHFAVHCHIHPKMHLDVDVQ